MTVRTSNLLLLVMIPILVWMVYLVETVMPEVTVNHISSPALHDFFAGRRVVQVTDIHLVESGWREKMTISKLRQLNPDIIFLTGDYIESYSDFGDLEDYIREIGRIAPALAIFGNNDYCCAQEVEKAFLSAGIPLLKNQSAVLSNGLDSIYVVGLEDNFLWRDDYFKASAAVPPGAERIVLGHAPAIVEKIDPDGVALVLSGHLHGGQIILPFYGSLARNTVCYVSRTYLSGVYHFNGINLFSNRGIGTSLLPFRFLARPEIALLEFSE